MKKIKLDGKLNLNKTTISKLNSEEMAAVQGGRGFLSIGKRCTRKGRCELERITRGPFCTPSLGAC